MADVKSKNLYELLGNDHEYDSDKEPEPPTKTVDKSTVRSGKRDAPKTAPVDASGGAARRGGSDRRAGGFSGSERAFRDRATGRNYNREQPTGENDDGTVRGRDGGPGTQRRGRGARGPRRGGDRHVNRSGISDHPKQGDQAWGQPTGDGEWNDEKAGDAIAAAEVNESGVDAGGAAPIDGDGLAADDAPEEEAEDSHKTYAEYLAEQAAKKMDGLGLKEARAPNEGAKDTKKWKGAKELVKGESEEYFKGEERARRERERASKKNFVDIDYAFKEQPRDSRGGRGGPRGGRGRGRGDFRGRGDRTDRGDRGGDRGDRDNRGDRGDRTDRGDRGSYRGRGRGGGSGGGFGGGYGGGDSANVAVNDENAFPSLGGK